MKLFIDDLNKTGKFDDLKYTFWDECFTSKVEDSCFFSIFSYRSISFPLVRRASTTFQSSDYFALFKHCLRKLIVVLFGLSKILPVIRTYYSFIKGILFRDLRN